MRPCSLKSQTTKIKYQKGQTVSLKGLCENSRIILGATPQELTVELKNHLPEQIFSMGKHSHSGDKQGSVQSRKAFKDGIVVLLGISVAVTN